MNKEKTVNFAGSLIVFFILLFVYSKFGPSLPINVTTQQKGDPLMVVGEGKVTVVPDIAKITVGIEEKGNTLKTVQESVNSKSNKIIEGLEKLGIEKKDIKTVSYSVYPQYNYDYSPARIAGYRVSTSYTISINDIEKVNDALSSVTGSGANVVGGISFEVNDKTKKEKLQEARELATKEAREKAEGLAKASGITLGKVINVSENLGTYDKRLYALPVAGGGGGLETTEANIQPGETEITVSITLSFEIR